MKRKINFKEILKYIWIVYAVVSIVIVIYLVDMLICRDIMEVSKRIVLNDHWNVTINDTLYEDVSLDDFLFEAVNKEDVVVMETVVPSDYNFKQAAMCINNRHAILSMYVDGQLEYEYGYDRYREGKATGSGFLFINFYEEYKGKELRLEYIVTEDDAFSNFDQIWISEWENAYRYIVTKNRLPLFIGFFLVILGIIMTVVQVFTVIISKKFRNVLLLALFSICLGIWTLCYHNVLLIFSIPLYSKSLMEHMALFIASLPLVAYIYTFVKETNKKYMAYIHNILFMVQLALTVGAIALHATNTIHAAEMVKYFHLMFLIHMVFFAAVLILRMKNNVKLPTFATVGAIIVAGCIVYELLTYFTCRYTKIQMVELKGVSSVGFVIFLGILVMDLYQRVTTSMMEEHEKELLFQRAFSDELTKLYNRAYCSDFMRKLSKEKNKGYTIINFDLNGLKKMNDTYGHLKGDELICHAANVLEKTFSTEGVVGRMGGDEFIVIMETDDREVVEQLLVNLNANIHEMNKENPGLGLSMSHGYATSVEVDEESHEKVYQLADERMYEYKQRVKKAMQA